MELREVKNEVPGILRMGTAVAIICETEESAIKLYNVLQSSVAPLIAAATDSPQ